ncbi:MAG: hypothetical protein P8N09_06675 [Planctomycetota bacterium]|nr:hypothetical protein [Planctomycetota bacterium]
MSCQKTSKFLTGLALLIGLLPAATGQDPAGSASAQPQVAQDGPRLIPAQGLTGFGRAIEEIDLHRVEPAAYVRRLEDVVQVDLGDVDLDADVIMTIDGKPFTQSDFRKRAIMYLAVNRVDEELTRVITENERAKRIAEGVDPATLEVTDEDLDEKVENLIKMVEMQARGSITPDQDAVAGEDAAAKARRDFLESIEASIGMEAYRQMMSAEVSFEKVFLTMPTEPQGGEVWSPEDGPPPEDDPKPDWIPQATWDALGLDVTGRQLRAFVKSKGAEGNPVPAFFRGQITTMIRNGVIKLEGVDYFFDTDLPDDVLVRLGDHDIMVDQLWNEVKDDLSDTDIELILREALTLEGIRSTLEAVGQWMDDEESAQAFLELNEEYEGTMFPLGSIIVLRGYRSLDRYREHWRHKEAYFRWRKKTLTDEEIEDHYRTSGRLFFERGTVEVDIAHDAIDKMAGPFNDERFAESLARMEAAYAAALAEGDVDAAVFQELVGEFPRPLTRNTQENTNPEVDRNFARNPLRIRLTESEMSMLITGYSMGDDIFYHGVDGEVFGPYAQRCRRHSWGAEINAGGWMARINGFNRDRPLAPLQDRELAQATEDFLDLNYMYWTQECLENLLPKVEVTTKN